jgi:hypothetical protein
MTSNSRRLNAALVVGVFLTLSLNACGGPEEEGNDPAVSTASDSSALSTDSAICHGRFAQGNPKWCLFTPQEKHQAAATLCTQVSAYYGQTLVVTNEDDHLPCTVWFDCCTQD